MAGRGFDKRLVRLEAYAPLVADDEGQANALPKLLAFIDANGGKLDGESPLMATARLLDMSTVELMAYLRSRAEGLQKNEVIS